MADGSILPDDPAGHEAAACDKHNAPTPTWRFVTYQIAPRNDRSAE
jgi:hypothetical protein